MGMSDDSSTAVVVAVAVAAAAVTTNSWENINPLEFLFIVKSERALQKIK